MKSISNQILAYILISLCIVFTAHFFYAIHIRTQHETEKLNENYARAIKRLAIFSEKPILNKDINLIKEDINIEALDENILSIQILDQNNKLYAGVLRTKNSIRPISNNQFLPLHQDSIIRPILYQGKTIGKVVLYINEEPLKQYVGKLKFIFFLELLAFFLIVAVILFLVLKIVVINPLSALKNWVTSINLGEKMPETKLFHSVEINTIIDSVSQLTERLTATLNENFSKSNQISEKESLITSISTNLPEGMIFRLITDDKGSRKFTYLSGSFQKIYGYSPEEGIADPFLIFGRVVKEDIQTLLDAEAESKRNLSTYRVEVRMINPDGSIRVSRFVSTPTIMEDGSVSWDGIELDITDLKKAQDDLFQNQFLLESITDGLPDSIFAKDLNGCYLFVNSALARRANKTRQELLGKNNSTIFLPHQANKTLEKDFEIMKSGKTQTFEEQLTSSSGNGTFLTTKGPIKDPDGKIVGLFGIARDITERKKAEEKLRVSQEKFELAFNSSTNAILIQDEQTGRYLEANASTAKIFGYSQDEILGKTSLELNFYRNLAFREKILNSLKNYGHIQNMEISGRHKSGMDLHLLLTVTRLYIDDKPFLYINMQDVTERKQVELELQKLNLDKDRFISILGHDLRGPVNSIIGLLDILNMNMNDMKEGEIKEIISLVNHSARNTSKLLDDVLLWATAKSGKMNFNPQNLNFTENCQTIIELLQFTAKSKNIEVELVSEPSLEVYADKNMLDTIIRNLISNAIKFTHDHGKIILKTQKDNEKTIISITDNGVGISAKDISKIFDKSQLFSSIGTNEEKGTGFGLKLCQEFVEKHGGKIWVESEVEIGTTFYFSLPNAK
ncbi:PAS domain-containing sensor histidine kinase [Flavobacterium aquiphilum]|uniref:PAS domain-containing sensor histidine kinase n=1 Tax=Flavobacterium aquiphilum TaxID=3003261 RepID=UPI0024805BFE|nr:PAS domain-containing sensor histidine kinase [Flavobacterium aquiphilum]